MVTTSEIQHTRLKGELVFQEFCLKLVRHYWQDDYAEAFGRSGQNQRGVDIVGRDSRNNYPHAGMQCKASETDDPRQLTATELAAEVEKAKKYRPKLDILIVAYAGDRDAALQQKAQELTAENARDGLFRVIVWSWPEIVTRAQNYPDLAQELLVHNQIPATTPVLNPARPITDPMAKFQAEITTAFEAYRIASTEVATNSETTVLDAKLDVYREQIRSGSGPHIVDSLRALIPEVTIETPGRVKMRVYGNLGAALAQAGDFDGAEDAFAQAGESDPDTAQGLSYKARAAMLRGRQVEAFKLAERAVEIDATCLPAVNIFLESAPRSLSTADLEQKAAAVAAEVDVASSLQRRYFSLEGDHEASLRVARAIAMQDWRKDAVVGQAILVRFEHNKEVRVGAPLAPTDQFLLEEAKTRLTRAWEQVKTRPDRHNWAFVAANLSAALRLVGNDDEADIFAMDVHALEPDDLALAQRCIFAHMHREDVAAAFRLATALAERSDADAEVWFLAASVAATYRKFEDSERWAQKAFSDPSGAESTKAGAATLIILTISRSKTPHEALAVAESIRSAFATNIGFEAQVAEIARRAGNEQALSHALAQLRAFERERLDATERFELADAFADEGDWGVAAELLDGLYQVDRPSEPLRRRLFYLYRADERAAARELFRSLGPRVLARPEVLRLGAAIYERSGLVEEALAVLDKAVAVDQTDLRSRLDWVRMAIRADREKRVADWARKAKASFDGSADELMELAQILNRYNRRRDAIAVGYGALAAHWGSSERLHMGYLSLFLLQFKKDRFLEIKTVREDAVVYLEDEQGEKAAYLIGAGPMPGVEILAADHDFAKSLIGEKVGTFVELSNIAQPVRWEIVAIVHKFVDLFRRALNAHSRLFPTSRAMGRFTLDLESKEPFQPIFEQARERSRLVSDAVKIYQENPIPVDTIAKALGSDAIDTSRGLRFQSDVWFDSCLGDHFERQLAFESLEGRSTVLVDALTIALWQEIGFLEIAGRMPLRVQVVQATIDEFAQRTDNARQALSQEGGALEARDGGVIMIKSTEEQREALLQANDALLVWVRAHTDLIPTAPLSNTRDKIEDLLSASTIDTIATALEAGSTIIAEDRRVRMIAAALGVTSSSWTQPLLMKLREEGALSGKDYVSLLVKLRRQRIGFVSSGSDELILATTMDDDTYNTLAEAITDARVDPNSLVPVASELACQFWTRPQFVDKRERYFSQIFNGVLRRPDGMSLFIKIAKMTYEALQEAGLVGFWLARLWNYYVDNFLRGHFIRTLVIPRSR